MCNHIIKITHAPTISEPVFNQYFHTHFVKSMIGGYVKLCMGYCLFVCLFVGIGIQQSFLSSLSLCSWGVSVLSTNFQILRNFAYSYSSFHEILQIECNIWIEIHGLTSIFLNVSHTIKSVSFSVNLRLKQIVCLSFTDRP